MPTTTALRSMANTNICVGPIAAPVRMYAATDSDSASFNLFHVHEDGSASRIRMPRTCGDCGAVCEQSELSRGVEVDGQAILVTDDEIAAIRPDCGRDFAVSSFCDPDEIPHTLYGTPYFLEPDDNRGRDAARKSYGLIVRALKNTGLIGLVKYTMRSKTHAAVLRVEKVGSQDVLVLQNIIWTNQLRQPEFATLRQPVELSDPEVEITEKFVGLMVKPFDPAEFADTSGEEIAELIAAKAAGRPMTAQVAAEAAEEVSVDDLLARLEAAVAAREASKSADLAEAVEAHPAGRRRRQRAKTA